MPALLKRILLVFLFALSFTTGFFASYFFLNFSKVFVKTPEGDFLEDDGPPIASGSYNILLLGYGGAGHDGGNLSDVIMVANINPERKKLTLISVPRDLWVEIPIRSDISQNFKINHAYAIGSDDRNYPLKEPQYKGEGGAGVLAKKVVGDTTGLAIHYFVAVDFESFKKIVDILGEIEVDVPVTFDDYFYPIKGRENDTCGKSAAEIARLHGLYSDTELHHQFECRYEYIHFDSGKVKMDGEASLKFVRSRASAQHGGDFARSQRQRAVLVAMKGKLISIYATRKIDDLFNEFGNLVRTDLDLATSKNLAQVLKKPEEYEINFLGLDENNVLTATKSLDGQFILTPKEGEGVLTGVQKFIFDELNKN